MQTEHKEEERQFAGGGGAVTCPNCRAGLVAGLRFCRMCGFRLGEGTEEYNETRRFDPARPPFAPPASTAAQNAPPYTQPHAWTPAPLAHVPASAPPACKAQAWRWTKLFTPWRWSWVGWVVLSFVIMTAVGAMIRDNNRGGGRGGGASISRSYLGVDGFETAEGGGAMIEGIAGPDTPVVRAGLIGGDVIKSFDGKPVEDADDLRRLLRATPAGKAVEVVYVRDGQTRTTMLTTGTEREARGSRAFEERPGGRGYIGVGLSSLERAPVPEMNVQGIRLGEIHTNRPADLAGLKRGDVVIEFNGQPVRTPGDLRYRIYEAAPGETVKVVVVRGGKPEDVMVKMGRSRDDDD